MLEQIDFDVYDPRVQRLIENQENYWGDPRQNKEKLIPYGIKYIDDALYGIDPDGELVVIQGEEKNRKTTLLANVLCNIMTWPRLKEKPVINIDSLESGMRPEKYKDTLISIMATRYLISTGHQAGDFCNMCGGKCRHMGISPKFLRFMERTKEQKDAVDYASDTIYEWPLLIHGASLKQGNTRSLKDAAIGMKDKKARWVRLIEMFGMRINAVDHGQQYAFEDDPTDYEKQLRSVAAIGDFVSQYGTTTFFLSQVSLTSARDVKANGGKLVAAGGAKAAQEANTVLSTSYKPGSGVIKIKIEESRDAGSFPVWQRLDDTSGCFYGDASIEAL
jgi:hypothetical protein